MPRMTPRYFTPATFAFLRGLARHNDRDWFARHRAEYEEHVRDPSLRLILDLAPNLAAISPLLVADPRPIGGSLFRIHRDTRFAADKRPYKTHVGIRFFHAATTRAARGLAGTAALGRLDAPVLYLHVEPRGCFVGGGIWHPAPPTLKRLRDFMVDNPRSWTRLTTARSFKAHFALGGEALARPPKGYPKDHPLLEDLKRKDLIAAGAISDAVVTGAGFDRLLLTRFRQLKPLCEWLALGLGLEF